MVFPMLRYARTRPEHWYQMVTPRLSCTEQLALGLMYLSGEVGEHDHGRAFQLLQVAADSGLAAAFNVLGTMHLKGQGTHADPIAAVDCFRRGAEAGDPHAHMSLAKCYSEGTGVGQSDETAFSHHMAAAEKGGPCNAWDGRHWACSHSLRTCRRGVGNVQRRLPLLHGTGVWAARCHGCRVVGGSIIVGCRGRAWGRALRMRRGGTSRLQARDLRMRRLTLATCVSRAAGWPKT